jgi:N-carbamoyl-L-amino-acid hydrolase
MTLDPGRNLRIDAARLWDTLMETARFGGTPKGGICRLAASEEDRQVRGWFREACGALGLSVTVDGVGNMFARREGRRPGLPPILIGSHLDTQPTGGKFDGVLGVLAALEAMRTLVAAGYETNAPVEIVNWTDEEGSRFSPAMMGSGVFAGVFTPEEALGTKDREGVTLGAALDGIGYRGQAAVGGRALSGYLELHIEQGPILEREEREIGVVQGVQAMRWYDARFTGLDAHTGATPMAGRRNALIGAARFALAVDAIANEHAPDAVATVGTLDVRPNSRNVVPGEALATVDARHPDDATLDAMEAEIEAAARAIAKELSLALDFARIWLQPAVRFDPVLIGCVREAAKANGFSARDITSGAGHDAAYVARLAPSTMVFVPCAGGVSHNEAESIRFEDAARGGQVLLDALLAFDAGL